ncbi:MAG: hypothetical protein LBG15_13920 [Dysgonamonadaceae bacterium]|jgi:hypothetical protein|nr:hypothetical protein [Dysgonamonadaceae bacterium]
MLKREKQGLKWRNVETNSKKTRYNSEDLYSKSPSVSDSGYKELERILKSGNIGMKGTNLLPALFVLIEVNGFFMPVKVSTYSSSPLYLQRTKPSLKKTFPLFYGRAPIVSDEVRKSYIENAIREFSE